MKLASRLSPLASGLLLIATATATQAAPTDKNFSYSWIEAGYSQAEIRGNLDLFDSKPNLRGGYLRGSWDIGENVYLIGGYAEASKSWKWRYDTLAGPNSGKGTEKLTLNQAEFGFGGYFNIATGVDFFGDLSAVRLGAEYQYKEKDPLGTDSEKAKDHIYAGKLMAGMRVKPISALELWGKAGVIRMNEESWLLKRDSAVGNVGAQFRITPHIGLVGEAELYKDIRLYRVGLRASF